MLDALEFGADVKRKASKLPCVSIVRRSFACKAALAVDFPAQGECPTNLRVGDLPVTTGAYSSYVDHEGRGPDTKTAEATSTRSSLKSLAGASRCASDRPYTRADGKRQVDCRTRYHFFAGLGLVKVVHEIRFTALDQGHALAIV